MRFLTALPKSYVGEIVLGVETTTLDADGQATAQIWDGQGFSELVVLGTGQALPTWSQVVVAYESLSGEALVVYETMWGSTTEIARAIVEGIGEVVVVEIFDVVDDSGAGETVDGNAGFITGCLNTQNACLR